MIIDFVYSTKRQHPGHLASSLGRSLGLAIPSLEVEEIHGTWGSLALASISPDRSGLFENDSQICMLIGNPVFVGQEGSRTSTRMGTPSSQSALSLYTKGGESWPLELSGPFAALIVEKQCGKAIWVTDAMAFIPLYERPIDDGLIVGSYVDAIANLGRPVMSDAVSLANFVLHGVVAYPFTFFNEVRQTPPAHLTTAHPQRTQNRQIVRRTYWTPAEASPYHSILEAAEDLASGVSGYIKNALNGAVRVAHFLSAGEDSRVVASLLRDYLTSYDRLDSYIYLDRLNREGLLAHKVARKLHSNLKITIRPSDHYLSSSQKMAALVGAGHPFNAAHSFPWAIEANLAMYDAVFGGLFSDSILKGLYVRKHAMTRNLPFLPQVASAAGCLPATDVDSGIFSMDILAEVNERRVQHYDRVAEFRPTSALEWFSLWPGTMRAGIANLYANRRLFKSYEPYMSLAALKVGAAAPVGWKLNRRLFYAAFKATLAKTRWIPHADGSFPAMPWWVNIPFATAQFSTSYAKRKLGLGHNDGPWTDWTKLQSSQKWHDAQDRYLANEAVRAHFERIGFSSSNGYPRLSVSQKRNLLQVGADLERHAARQR